MGINRRYTMVLLSTLAALVIIVHSADEDYEGNYRRERELRPRMLETETRRYEQPWRTMKGEPMLQLSTPDPIFEESSTEEPLRRRRPGRKRKRRPYPTEDIASHERISIDEPLRPNIEIEDIKPADPPKRRRKKQNRSKWTDDEDRPMRRRGQRKRPTAETWPAFSEFSDYRPNKKPHEENIEISTDETDTLNIEGYNKAQNHPQIETNSEYFVEIPERVEVNNKNDYEKHPDDHSHDDSVYPPPAMEVQHFEIKPILKDDKSFSEFSVEEYPVHDTRSEREMKILKEKIQDKSPAYLEEFLKYQDKGPIDPLTLKEILKKSNGSSLSEILQQHNLSLTDLLHGKEVALTILKNEEPAIGDESMPKVLDVAEVSKQIGRETMEEGKEYSEEKLLQNSETKYAPGPKIEPESILTIQEETTTPVIIETTSVIKETTTTEKVKIDDSPKRSKIRRFPVGNRRKQHIRPVIHTNTYKSPLNRDMIAMNARKYFNNHRRRNTTRSPEWKDVIPIAKKNISNPVAAETEETTIANIIFEETTLQYKQQDDENVAISAITEENDNVNPKNIPKETASNDLIINESTNPETKTSMVNNEKVIPIQETVNATGLRRQAYNNVLKKKRRKLKYSTTEPPQDDLLKNMFGMPNLVSSSEFIARTQGPKTSLDDVTILEDFITTETAVVKHETKPKHTRYSTTMANKPIVTTTTEETAKIEIEEILNDSGVSAKLSRILKERNMTLSELVEHRERGSSHVHLADIFQNTSKEVSNPPEPFLSKSLIEPISKETYPLRALLEGKIHETTTKATTTEVNTVGGGNVNVPVKMDFGNNVNENAENMGIMSLFQNIKTNVSHEEESIITKDSEGRPYTSSVTVVKATDASDTNDTVRKGRLVHELKDNNQDDIVSWNEIFSLMRRNYENRTKYIKDGIIPAELIKKPTLEEDIDGDGLIVLEDLEHLHDFDNNIAASKENLDAHTNERIEATVKPSIFDKIPSQTRSVTLATASIVGLVLVLFLLICVGYKWRQHNKSSSKKNFNERIPSPVFEHRKGHKNNSSSRSISPMLTSNIYTLSTVDSQNGKESPEYMWDSLRKPFQ